MIDIIKSKEAFKNFLNSYENKDKGSYKLKVIHTYHVAENAKDIAEKLGLTKEDIDLAELIGLLHDIGRFEELNALKEFDSVHFDHAKLGVKMLFEDGMIRDFIQDDKYDEIIKVAIDNHSRLKIEDGLDKKSLLHSKIIRDADKLDNFRVKVEENIEDIFPNKVKSIEEMENSLISDKVYETIKNKECINICDRKTPLDFLICILAFTFDLNFDVTYKIVKENRYIDTIIDKFDYKDKITKTKMEEIRNIINEFIDGKLI